MSAAARVPAPAPFEPCPAPPRQRRSGAARSPASPARPGPAGSPRCACAGRPGRCSAPCGRGGARRPAAGPSRGHRDRGFRGAPHQAGPPAPARPPGLSCSDRARAPRCPRALGTPAPRPGGPSAPHRGRGLTLQPRAELWLCPGVPGSGWDPGDQRGSSGEPSGPAPPGADSLCSGGAKPGIIRLKDVE